MKAVGAAGSAAVRAPPPLHHMFNGGEWGFRAVRTDTEPQPPPPPHRPAHIIARPGRTCRGWWPDERRRCRSLSRWWSSSQLPPPTHTHTHTLTPPTPRPSETPTYTHTCTRTHVQSTMDSHLRLLWISNWWNMMRRNIANTYLDFLLLQFLHSLHGAALPGRSRSHF